MESIKKAGNEVLAKRYAHVRKQTERICTPLNAEDYVVQPIVDVSPPKWHLAHTSWFFENFILKKFLRGYKVFHPSFNYIFNSYYESVGERLLRTDRGNLTRPSTEEIYTYREYVDRKIAELLEEKLNLEIITLLELGLQHEMQHQELLITDIKYILGHNPLFPVYTEIFKSQAPASLAEFRFLEIPEGIYEIGFENGGFCFDNERPVHKRYIRPFRIMDRLVSNREYMQFVMDGGYQNFEFWLADGWDWVNKNNIQGPLYWIRKEGEWHEYTLGGLKELDLNLPVTHISFYEADAFANWAGKRIPTEFEWEAAARTLKPDEKKANILESGLYHPSLPKGDSLQLLGDCWEWTYSAYHPFPGYKREEGALGEYNGKFMISQMVLRGGSCATPFDQLRVTYRNFFQPDKRWQFTGIRLAEDF